MLRPNQTDIFPPAKIIDARWQLIDTNNASNGLIVQFTAPGDDYDTGNGKLVISDSMARTIAF